MDRGVTILQLMRELQVMPEYLLYCELQSLSNSIYTLDKNFVDLHNFVMYITTDENARSVWWLRNRDQLQGVGREAVRLTHNFVAAALSLIDHTRNIYDKLYSTNNHFPEYQNRVDKEFKNDDLAQFIKCLRKYCQHYKAPSIEFVSHAERLDQGLTTSIMLPIAELRSFDGWSSRAKTYLAKVEKGVDILKVSRLYHEKVLLFYQWFQSRQLEIHAPEIQRFKDKEAHLLLLMLEDKIDLWFANEEYRKRSKRDDVFLSIFRSNEFDELEKITDFNKRAQCAIDLLGRHFSVPDEVKHRIILLYQQP